MFVNSDVKCETVSYQSIVLICAGYPAVAQHGENDASVHESASHASGVHGYYSSQPGSSFDYSAPVSD